jgi:hypothetical protein
MSMGLTTVETAVVAARKRGDEEVIEGGVDFSDIITASGMCSKFQRLSALAAKLPADPFSCCAHSTGQHLDGAGKRIGTLVPGALLVFTNGGPICSRCGQTVGHIACYLGDGQCAENTSSGSRGDPRAPGCKLTPLRAVDPDGSRLWGIFALSQLLPVESYAAGEIIWKFNPDVKESAGYNKAFMGYFDGTTAFARTGGDGGGHQFALREWAERLGCVRPYGIVAAHFAESPRCVYVYGPESVFDQFPGPLIPWVRE